MSNVVNFPKGAAPEFMVGPFAEHRVVLEGKRIPSMTAFNQGDQTFLVLDDRLSIGVPKELGYMIAWFAANAMAIGAGYPCFTADEKVKAFARNVRMIGEPPSDAAPSN